MEEANTTSLLARKQNVMPKKKRGKRDDGGGRGEIRRRIRKGLSDIQYD
jgi:hypothetical protein